MKGLWEDRSRPQRQGRREGRGGEIRGRREGRGREIRGTEDRTSLRSATERILLEDRIKDDVTIPK